MNLYMGHSYQEKSIFVSKKDYNKALDLISVITSNDAGKKELFEEEQQEKDRASNTLTLISK